MRLNREFWLQFAPGKMGPIGQGTQQPAEQQQIERIRRLVKERDALAEQLGQPVKPPADENLDHSRAKP